MNAKSANGQALIDALKSLFRGLFKLLAVLLSWGFKFLGVLGEKMGDFFEKLSTKN